MTPIVMLAAWAALGVNAGYEPASDGQLEYIVQIEPQLLDGLTQGRDVVSEIPPGLDVRHFRVTVGTGKLPRRTAAAAGRNTAHRPPTSDVGALEPAGEETPEVRSGYQPLAGQNGEYVIEITPTGLNDLHSHDLAGDVPAGVPVGRLRISTQPGSAPAGSAAAPVSRASVPAAAAPHAAAPPAELGSAAPRRASDFAAPAVATVAQPVDNSGMVDITPAERNQLQPVESADEHADAAEFDPPGDPRLEWPGNSAAPAAAAPDNSRPARPTLAAPSQPAVAPRETPTAARPRTNERRELFPSQLEPDPQAAALDGENATFEQPPRTEHAAQKPSTTVRKSQTVLQAGEEKAEQLYEEAKEKPWLLLTLTALALCVSCGANVYLGWIAWDARNRSRMLLEKFHAGELSLS